MKKVLILLLALVMLPADVLCVGSRANAEEKTIWTCPECGRENNHGNYCGLCGHRAPWFIEDFQNISFSEMAALLRRTFEDAAAWTKETAPEFLDDLPPQFIPVDFISSWEPLDKLNFRLERIEGGYLLFIEEDPDYPFKRIHDIPSVSVIMPIDEHQSLVADFTRQSQGVYQYLGPTELELESNLNIRWNDHLYLSSRMFETYTVSVNPENEYRQLEYCIRTSEVDSEDARTNWEFRIGYMNWYSLNRCSFYLNFFTQQVNDGHFEEITLEYNPYVWLLVDFSRRGN